MYSFLQIIPPECFLLKCAAVPINTFLPHHLPEISKDWKKMLIFLDIPPDTEEYKKIHVAQDECIPGGESHSLLLCVEKGNPIVYFCDSNNSRWNIECKYYE
jgi:hypothetical protein